MALDPFVDQLLAVLGQLPAELHPILLAETALAVRLGERAPAPGGGRR